MRDNLLVRLGSPHLSKHLGRIFQRRSLDLSL